MPSELRRWERIDGTHGRLVPAGRTYDCRFRTFPDPGEPPSELRFAALGDHGVGIQTDDPQGEHQRRLAGVLERLVEGEPGIDLVLTLGDNIYLAELGAGGSGGEDDDWYFSHDEPYRFVLSRVPVYPTVGNHDSDETEESDDREQLADNHFTEVRFRSDVEAGRDLVTATGRDVPGLLPLLHRPARRARVGRHLARRRRPTGPHRHQRGRRRRRRAADPGRGPLSGTRRPPSVLAPP